ncbi:MAG: hypothetical protein IT359_10865 [Gemmatimonadaceae bacterium]|nr:hypothetical protein [Gemmatimonadaceae bacterium]
MLAIAIYGFARSVRKDVAAAHGQYLSRRQLEEATVEEASWFGRTGLDEATERELPRYLRREFGEFLDDPDGLKADDLQYLGVLTNDRGAAHFWKVPSKGQREPYFAYVEIDREGNATSLGWGDRTPSPRSDA